MLSVHGEASPRTKQPPLPGSPKTRCSRSISPKTQSSAFKKVTVSWCHRRPTKVVGFHPGAGEGRGGRKMDLKVAFKKETSPGAPPTSWPPQRPRDYSDLELPSPHPRSQPPDPARLMRRKPQQARGRCLQILRRKGRRSPPNGARIHRRLAGPMAGRKRPTAPAPAARVTPPSPLETTASNPRS